VYAPGTRPTGKGPAGKGFADTMGFSGWAPEVINGRGLHSSAFQVNLSRFGHTSLCSPV